MLIALSTKSKAKSKLCSSIAGGMGKLLPGEGFDIMGYTRSRRTLMLYAQDLVERLQELIREHGNAPVVMDDESEPNVEFNEDDGPPAFVIS